MLGLWILHGRNSGIRNGHLLACDQIDYFERLGKMGLG